jgi:ABC-2 type transport system ATP-binding protein
VGSSPPTVVFDAVTKRYGDIAAIEEVSFAARPGRVLGLLGRNGAGKTTTLRVLLGLAAPTSGSATVFGRAITAVPDAHRRIGVTMEGLGHLPGASARRELKIWSTLLGVDDARAKEVLEMVDLPTSDGRPIAKYSTGMRQRFELALALLADPEVLVLDEPAGGLDPVGVRWLRDLVRQCAADGRTVILSSHHLAEVEQAVDDVVILQRTVRYAGELGDLTDSGRASLEDRFLEIVGPDAKESLDA